MTHNIFASIRNLYNTYTHFLYREKILEADIDNVNSNKIPQIKPPTNSTIIPAYKYYIIFTFGNIPEE